MDELVVVRNAAAGGRRRVNGSGEYSIRRSLFGYSRLALTRALDGDEVLASAALARTGGVRRDGGRDVVAVDFLE
jgi:hypothetical protein